MADGDEVLALTVPDAEGEVRSILVGGVVDADRLEARARDSGGELERRVYQAALRLMLGEQPVDDQAGAEVQALIARRPIHTTRTSPVPSSRSASSDSEPSIGRP